MPFHIHFPAFLKFVASFSQIIITNTYVPKYNLFSFYIAIFSELLTICNQRTNWQALFHGGSPPRGSTILCEELRARRIFSTQFGMSLVLFLFCSCLDSHIGDPLGMQLTSLGDTISQKTPWSSGF